MITYFYSYSYKRVFGSGIIDFKQKITSNNYLESLKILNDAIKEKTGNTEDIILLNLNRL